MGSVVTIKNSPRFLRDTLVNFLTSLGTIKDPSKSNAFTFAPLDKVQVEYAFRADWVARKIVTAPANDSTREWREWQAGQDQIELIEGEEKRLDLRRKLTAALVRARLYGGAAIVMGIDQGLPEDEVDFETLGKDCLKWVHVMHMYELGCEERISDINSKYFGRPQFYTIGSSQITGMEKAGEPSPASKIHPSRIIEFVGAELPDFRLQAFGGNWGDSVLQSVDDAVKGAGIVSGGIVAMIHDAKMDVIKIPGLAKNIADPDYKAGVLARFGAANAAKSSINTLVLDDKEEWERISTNFAALPDLLRMYLLIASGAADIPASRMLGQSPQGLLGAGASGDTDIRNYYDRVSSEQETILSPGLIPLDQALITSALGKDDPSIFYNWRPLWQLSDTEKADIATKKANSTKADVDMGLINEEVLRESRVNQLIEDGTYPGLQDNIDEFGIEPPAPEGHFDPQTGQPLAGTPAAAALSMIKKPPLALPAFGDENPNHDERGRFAAAAGAAHKFHSEKSEMTKPYKQRDLPFSAMHGAAAHHFGAAKEHFMKGSMVEGHQAMGRGKTFAEEIKRMKKKAGRNT